MIPRCDDPDCRSYKKQFVDRGYGYPVCPSNRPSLNWIPMNPKYEGTYNKEEEDVATQDNRTVIYPDGKNNAGKVIEKKQAFRKYPEPVK